MKDDKSCKKCGFDILMIKNADKIDYDIKSKPLSKEESHRLSQEITEYKKRKSAKRKKVLPRKKVL
jgi:hypothetical protein